jgi:hypothetical protein
MAHSEKVESLQAFLSELLEHLSSDATRKIVEDCLSAIEHILVATLTLLKLMGRV